MANVTYDDRSFILDGQRIWLTSGSLHYFRVPAALWEDRLLKAKRAGLNCIDTYIAWNRHEQEEGEWDFSGDRDLVEFIRIADELGLYVILRPGPYICAEWDFGGLPAWLNAKSGMSVRTNNAAYMHYFDKYFAQVLPRLAEWQVTQGGNIILIQNENEYFYTTQPDREEYLEFISQLFLRAGFDIPIITCNFRTEPQPEETIDCVNGWDSVVPQLKALRTFQPDAPLLVTEFWSGWFDFWGGQHAHKPAEDVARHAMSILGCGGQINYYMFHGGTNFGFWSSRLVAGPGTWQTTSYDYDAPLAEGGGLTRKYYLTKLVNMTSTYMGPYLAQAKLQDVGATIHDASNVLNLVGPHGRWAMVTNGGRSEIQTVHVSLPNGHSVTADLRIFGAALLPCDLALPDGHTLEFSSLTPLGLFGGEQKRVLLLYGPVGAAGSFRIDGRTHQVTVPKTNTPEVVELGGLTVIVLPTELAMRTWRQDHRLLFGPDYVGMDEEDIVFGKIVKSCRQWDLETGKMTALKAPSKKAPRVAAPRLSNWTRTAICPEPVDDDLEWKKLDRPKDVSKLGHNYGYLWYRIDIEQDRAKKRNLLLPEIADRAQVYLNGEHLGCWGRGPDASLEPIGAPFKKGKNTLVLLLDILGRHCYGHDIGDPKGLFGHVWDARKLRTNKFKLKPAESFPKRIIPRNLSHMADQLETLPVHAAELSLPLSKLTSVHLRFEDIPHHCAVFCNDRPVGFFPKHGGRSHGEILLGAELKKGKNVIRFLLWGEEIDPACMENVRFFELTEPLSAGADWATRPWTQPEDGAREPIKNKPCWYSARFKYNESEEPLFLKIFGAKKGQLFLNGVNLGRFWTVGPQEWYYLPKAWLADENELVIFEEQGNMPQRCKLQFLSNGPFEQ